MLEGARQFVVPVYQRPYSWELKHCKRLLSDVVRAGEKEEIPAHFFGSIVYMEKSLYETTFIPQHMVIDGQQRLTTVSMLLHALGAASERRGIQEDINQRRITDNFLMNPLQNGESRYKLILTQTDKNTLIRLFAGEEQLEPLSKRIIQNYQFFLSQLNHPQVDLMAIYRGIRKLIVVEIALSREHDNPQLIFETLNSTGLELSQADLIRNYILMPLKRDRQELLYNTQWFPMEQSFGQEQYAKKFDQFMRDYLTVKMTGIIPKINQVYERFKAYKESSKSSSTEEIVADINRYSKYFVRIALEKEKDEEINLIFHDINRLTDVAYPFLLELCDDYQERRLNREEFIEILRLVESYVFRRTICALPTNSHGKTFATLSRDIDKADYVASFKATLWVKDGNERFPPDDMFRREFEVSNVYSPKSRKYCLDKLENFDSKERIDCDHYTIEHIMPQNKDLPEAWKTELGDNWQEVQDRRLHTIGNLTLTAYNPEMSDRSFVEKRDMRGGFKHSRLRLNRGLAELQNWNEAEIQRRAQELADDALTIWPALDASAENIEKIREKKHPSARKYTLADHKHLTGDMMLLFEELRKRIRSLHPDVCEEATKHYIGYKLDTHFVDVIPQKRRLLLTLNLAFPEISDPQGKCKDVTGKGRLGNGEVQVGFEGLEDVDYIMTLIRQALDNQIEHDDVQED